MDLLHIPSLRRGADGRNADAPNAANYDESKANPYPTLPDPLVLKNGKKVTKPAVWWKQRRPEIVEDFDREIYGRLPKDVPKVNWEVTGKSNETIGDAAVITKKLVGHVDNSAYPHITVDIQITLTTPVNAAGPVPVILEFGFTGPFARGAAAPGPTWQQQVLAKGWGYAVLLPTSIQADNGQGLTQGVIGLVNKGQPRKPDDWGALRAWAWGASRVLDYFETDKCVDAKRVGIEGHSRYGKATVVAMAYDPRFAIAFISSSGGRWCEAAPPQLGRTGGKCGGGRRIPLDGRQLPEIRGRFELERYAGALARISSALRAAPSIHQRRSHPGRRMGGCQRYVPGRRRCRTGLPPAGQKGPGHR